MKRQNVLGALAVLSLLCGAFAAETTYKLQIFLEDEDIKFLNELGYSICIVRDVVGFDLDAVWHSIPPNLMSQSNELQWTEDFYVFHQETIQEAGDTLHFTTQTQTPLQQSWTFQTTFDDFKEPVMPGTVVVHDEHQSIHMLGLAQKVNGQVKPLGAIPSANGITVSMAPKEYVYVFIGRNQESELLSLTAVSNPAKVEYFKTTSMAVKFNKESAQFTITRTRATT